MRDVWVSLFINGELFGRTSSIKKWFPLLLKKYDITFPKAYDEFIINRRVSLAHACNLIFIPQVELTVLNSFSQPRDFDHAIFRASYNRVELILVPIGRVGHALSDVNPCDCLSMRRVLGLDMPIKSIHDVKVPLHSANRYDLAIERSRHDSDLIFLIVIRHHEQLLAVKVLKLRSLLSLKGFPSDYLIRLVTFNVHFPQ